MKRRRILDSETRRLVMSAWCRIWWGDDGWLQVDSRMITAAVLAALAVWSAAVRHGVTFCVGGPTLTRESVPRSILLLSQSGQIWQGLGFRWAGWNSVPPGNAGRRLSPAAFPTQWARMAVCSRSDCTRTSAEQRNWSAMVHILRTLCILLKW